MSKQTIKKIKYFVEGFTNAFTPIEDNLLKNGGCYMKTISAKRKEKLITYEKNRSGQESSRNGETASA
jgi:hypothetical protein